MNDQVPIAQPAVTVVELTDITAAKAGIELIDLDAVQLQSRPLRVRRVIVRLEAATVMYQSCNLRARTRSSVRDGQLAYVTFGPHASGTVNGLPVRPGLMLAAETGAEGMFVVHPPGWESMTLLIPPQDILMHLRIRQREDEFRMPHGVEILQADTDKVRGLFAWCKRLVDVAARLPTFFAEGKKERDTAQVELLENLLATLGGAHDLVPARVERTLQARHRVVKIAEDYALAHVDDILYVSDLCRAAAVSERTLEALFKETMGLTPMAYLVRLRLHRVRQALVDATHGSTTVSAEALNWGFWHFGEFSRAYKDCFGELPSDTLRRRPGELSK